MEASMTAYATLLDRVAGLCGALPPSEQALAARVLAIGRELDRRPRQAGRLLAEPGDLELVRELSRLTEQLGRRTSLALPAATLGRAALADLYGDASAWAAIIADCDAKLALLGH
jgi:hypothetical protein